MNELNEIIEKLTPLEGLVFKMNETDVELSIIYRMIPSSLEDRTIKVSKFKKGFKIKYGEEFKSEQVFKDSLGEVISEILIKLDSKRNSYIHYCNSSEEHPWIDTTEFIRMITKHYHVTPSPKIVEIYLNYQTSHHNDLWFYKYLNSEIEFRKIKISHLEQTRNLILSGGKSISTSSDENLYHSINNVHEEHSIYMQAMSTLFPSHDSIAEMIPVHITKLFLNDKKANYWYYELLRRARILLDANSECLEVLQLPVLADVLEAYRSASIRVKNADIEPYELL